MGESQIIFTTVLILVITQRLIELYIAKRNTLNLVENGAFEFGKEHYWILVLLHTSFFISLILQAAIKKPELSQHFLLFLSIFVVAQVGRVWVIRTLGNRWTTRILVMKGKKLVEKGPFRIFRHPNYFIVALELFSIPMIFNMYSTAILFSALNALVLLRIRIPEENRALQWSLSDAR